MKNQWTPIFSNKSIRKNKAIDEIKKHFVTKQMKVALVISHTEKIKKNNFSSFWMPVIKQNFGKATRQT